MAIDEDGHESEMILKMEKSLANSGESVIPNIKKNLSKTGNTVFVVDEIDVQLIDNWFLPISKVNEIRRDVLQQLVEIRISQ